MGTYSMTTQIGTVTYNDFKAVIKVLTSKGTVFFFTDGATVFKAGFLAKDLSCFVFLSGLTTEPATFTADFPGAIAVENAGLGGTADFSIG